MELLVVIGIIGLLSSMTTYYVNYARAKTRDTIRIQHINTIRTALDLYYMDHGEYPGAAKTGGTWNRYTCCSFPYPWVINDSKGFFNLNDALKEYLENIPKDPLSYAPSCFGGYSYCYFVNDSGSEYDLITLLETDHPLRCELKDYISHTGGWNGALPQIPGPDKSWCDPISPWYQPYIYADH